MTEPSHAAPPASPGYAGDPREQNVPGGYHGRWAEEMQDAPADPCPASGAPMAGDGTDLGTGKEDSAATSADVTVDNTADLQELRESIDALQSDVCRTLAELGTLTEAVDARDGLISSMQEAVSEGRRDQISVLLTPTARKMIDLQSELLKASTDDYSRSRPENIVSQFLYFSEGIEDILERLGFLSVDAKEGDRFDARRHNAVETVPVTDPSLDKTIHSVLRQGFSFVEAKKVAFPAKVMVREYHPEDTAPEPVQEHVPGEQTEEQSPETSETHEH